MTVLGACSRVATITHPRHRHHRHHEQHATSVVNGNSANASLPRDPSRRPARCTGTCPRTLASSSKGPTPNSRRVRPRNRCNRRDGSSFRPRRAPSAPSPRPPHRPALHYRRPLLVDCNGDAWSGRSRRAPAGGRRKTSASATRTLHPAVEVPP